MKYEIEENNLQIVFSYIENNLNCNVGNPLLNFLGRFMVKVEEPVKKEPESISKKV